MPKPKNQDLKPITQERIKQLEDFQQNNNLEFQDIDILNQALMHSSYSFSKDKKIRKDNQRLEFLGDSCLSLVVTEYLYKKYIYFPEGQLSKVKNFVVSEKVLYQLALLIDLGSCLLMSPGEIKNQGNLKSGALSDAFEALIGSIYLDQGYEKTKEFLLPFIEDEVNLFLKKQSVSIDYKSELQYIVQKKYKTYPLYTLLKEEGPNHNKEFVMEVSILGKHQFSATGKTKKDAEQKAAQCVYEEIKNGNIKL